MAFTIPDTDGVVRIYRVISGVTKRTVFKGAFDKEVRVDLNPVAEILGAVELSDLGDGGADGNQKGKETEHTRGC